MPKNCRCLLRGTQKPDFDKTISLSRFLVNKGKSNNYES